jgi:hypothetical protein
VSFSVNNLAKFTPNPGQVYWKVLLCVLGSSVIIKELRNLYVQLDNVSSHKSDTRAADFAALIDLGTCKKVEISYLDVIFFYT